MLANMISLFEGSGVSSYFLNPEIPWKYPEDGKVLPNQIYILYSLCLHTAIWISYENISVTSGLLLCLISFSGSEALWPHICK